MACGEYGRALVGNGSNGMNPYEARINSGGVDVIIDFTKRHWGMLKIMVEDVKDEIVRRSDGSASQRTDDQGYSWHMKDGDLTIMIHLHKLSVSGLEEILLVMERAVRDRPEAERLLEAKVCSVPLRRRTEN